MNPNLRRVVAATSVVFALSLAAAPAQAELQSRVDQTGDVWQFNNNATGTSDQFIAAPDQTDGDVTSTNFNYAEHELRFVTKFVELKKKGEIVFSARVRTNEGRHFDVEMEAPRKHPQGVTHLYRMRDDKPVKCKMRSAVDYTAFKVTVGVPRGCLSAPRWVQATTADWRMLNAGQDLFIDNPQNAKARPTGWTQRLHRG